MTETQQPDPDRDVTDPKVAEEQVDVPNVNRDELADRPDPDPAGEGIEPPNRGSASGDLHREG